MRPVDRGSAPFESKDYRLFGPELQRRLGDTCCYCGGPGANTVEHILPQEHFKQLVNEWSNLLLCCGICQSVKRDWPQGATATEARGKAVWPDQDNTAVCFERRANGQVEVSAFLSPEQKSLAQNLLERTGLDRHPEGPARVSKLDFRYIRRRDQWTCALRFKFRIDGASRLEEAAFREDAITAAKGGDWSVWRTVFEHDPEMLLALNAIFPGTADCFDRSTGAPLARGHV